MITTLAKADLIAFEERVKAAFLEGRIRAPIHLSTGNEDQLLAISKDIRPQDWVFSTWRSHYHALLKGIDPEWLFAEILAGRSMYLSSAEHRFLSSAIVGGTLPIAVGVAAGIARNRKPALHAPWCTQASVVGPGMACEIADGGCGGHGPITGERVWVFVGDMAAEAGAFHEAAKYAGLHGLPITFVVEDNGLSTNTDTGAVWGHRALVSQDYHNGARLTFDGVNAARACGADVKYYRYERNGPHVGAGKFVVFS